VREDFDCKEITKKVASRKIESEERVEKIAAIPAESDFCKERATKSQIAKSW
jgi:hypothetical protein